MEPSVVSEINELRKMKVSELRQKWIELYGEPSRSCNKDFLFRRLCWRLQELRFGGLSARAKSRIEELNRGDDLRLLPPRNWKDTIATAIESAPAAESGPVRDPRLPKPGTILSRVYQHTEIKVTVLESGFLYSGRTYSSLSAIATEITGVRWNGPAFFHLGDRKRRS